MNVNGSIQEKSYKKTSYPYVPKGPPLELPPCKVCGGKASGIHYGVNTCEACKGFFRRFLLRKEPYKCTYGGKCEISDRHRGNCSACRMQKCLQLGMSKEGIRQGRYTLTERTKTIIEVKKLQLESDASAHSNDPDKNLDFITVEVSQKSPGKSSNPSPACVPTELNFCNNFPQLSPENHRDVLQLSPDGLDVVLPVDNFDSDISRFLDDEGFTFDGSIPNLLTFNDSTEVITTEVISPEVTFPNTEKFEDTIVKLLEGLEEVRPHSNLSNTEIRAILKEGHDKYHLNTQIFGPLNALSTEEYNEVYTTTNLDVDGRKGYLLKNKGMLEVIIKKYVNFSHKIPGFSELPANDQASLLKASRFEFFLLLEYRSIDPDLEMILTYTGDVFHLNEACIYVPKEMMKSWLEFTRCIRRLELTDPELAVVLSICVTFRDRCKLSNPLLTQNIQTYLTDVLKYLLEDHHGDTCHAKLTQIMDMFTEFRELTVKYYHHFKTSIQHCQLIKEQLPEILEFVFDE